MLDACFPALNSPSPVLKLKIRIYAVVLSNDALPAAAWYFPTVVRFSPAERKTNNKKKIKYRCG
jgi:hypothetical protein